MTKIAYKVPSCDGIHTLAGTVYLPAGEVRGFFQVVHGMTEHIGRYDAFMSDMAKAGYICFGHDHLGHGYTAKDDSELGYIAKKNGYDLLTRDVKVFADAVIAAYDTDRHLPYYLMGHSMGSFVVRYAATKYVHPDRLIVMGTGGRNPAAGMGLAVIDMVKFFRGDRYISKTVYALAFASYNARFGGGTEDDPSPWLTNDKAHREKYYADKFCTFKFTVSAMKDLVTLNKITNDPSWYKTLPHDMPLLLVSGEDDPVGDHGDGVRQVYGELQRQGFDVQCILYPKARHEILNDSTYEQVKTDILKFIQT